MRKIYFLISLIMAINISYAQLYVNTFTGASGCPTNGNIPTVAINGTGTPLSRNTITCSATANVFNSTTLNNTASVSNSSYIEFSVTANAGFQLNITSLSFLRQGSNTAPNQLEVRYSTDNFASSTDWGAAPLTPTSGSVATWDFTDFSTVSGVAVTIRFYPYGTQRCDLTATPASAAGTFRLDDITLNGTVTASGGPSLSATTLTAFGNVCINNTGTPNVFTINGSSLSNANVNVGPLNGFTFSTTPAGAYTSSLSLTQPGGTYTQDIYVKFSPVVVQSYNGNIIIGGGGASDYNEEASGSGVDTKPSVKAGTTLAITGTTASVSDTITATGCSPVTVYGVEYSMTNDFTDGTGTAVTGSNLSGGIYSVNLSGLTAATTYYYKAYATNNGGTSYSTQRSFTTLTAEPANHVTLFACGTTTINSISLTWTDATGTTVPAGYLIKWSSVGFNAIANPVDGIPEANGPGTLNVAQGAGSVSATSLSPVTTYYFKIFPYTNSGSLINYKTDGIVPQTNCATQSGPIAAWDLTGLDAVATATATVFNANLVSASGGNNMTRGPGANASGGNNSFRTTGFQNNGISTGNTDYFQVTLSPQAGYLLSLSSINARFAGTASFAAAPGVISQFAYSLDGTNFTLIGPASITTGTPATLPVVDLSGVSGLQNIAGGTIVTLRYYASGQTTSGGWGFNSPSPGIYGFAIGGSLATGAGPNIVVNPTSLPAFTSVVGVPSTEQTYTVSGTSLTNNITITPPPGFEVSTTSGSGFVSNPSFLTLTHSGGIVNTTIIYARMNSATAGANNGIIANVSSGATTRNVSLSGNVLAAEPSSQGTITFGTITNNSIVVNFSGGNGTKRIVLAKAVSAVNGDPVDGITYSGNPVFTGGSQIGSGNYVVYAGSGSSVTVTGLNSGATYHFAVYSYNDGNTNGAENYLTATPGTGNAATLTSNVTYTWTNGGGDNVWTNSANWSPIRTSFDPGDIIQFNDGGTYTITGVTTQTIRQMSVANNTSVNLQAAATTTLTIGGGAGTDLGIGTGSQLNVDGANAMTILLSTGATAVITGNMTYTNAAHKLDAADASGITFSSPAVFTQGTGCTGNVFTNAGTVNAIVFGTGTTFVQAAGNNPFVFSAPGSKVVFQAGNLFKITGAGLSPSFSGRTYANVEFAGTGTSTMTGASAVSIDNLTVSSGVVNVNMTGASGHSIKGNILVRGGGALNFNPSSAGTIQLNGTTSQVIVNNGGAITFGANETLLINNVNNISLSANLSVNALTLAAGNIVTGDSLLIVATAITGGSTTSYVRTSGTGSLTINNVGVAPKTFPVGNAKYNPVVIENGSGHNWTVRVADTITADAGFNTTKAVLASWMIKPSSNPPAAGADITFQFDEATQSGASFSTATNVQAWRRPLGAWLRSGSPAAVNTTVPNAATVKVTGLTGFSQYGLSNIDGPLPVAFGDVKATQVTGGVKVDWSNYTEMDVVDYHVERSADGRNFVSIGELNARLNNGGKAGYSFIDAAPLSGINFYRIRSFETTSKIKYSIIAKVDLRGGATQLVLYPNPANNGQLTYQVNNLVKGKYTLMVFNSSGQQVYSKVLNHQGGSVSEAITIPSARTGVYTLQIVSEENKFIKTFVVQ